MPDPFQPAEKTISASRALIGEIKGAGFRTMFVPQSEIGDLENWITAYKWAAENDDIDIIGMSTFPITPVFHSVE